MSSPEPFVSSPNIADGLSRKSKFTYRHLSQLSHFSPTCPLRVIAHIDLDAFYAQCEMVRLGVPEDQPLAVQQWQGLIAINYPARAYGLSRHVTITEAKEKCPDIVLQHVATWKEGEDRWAYRDGDVYKHIATHKVSLDPYRMESRRILAVIKETLPQGQLQRVEKASIDEVFLDLSAHVHSVMLERFPELKGPPPYDDPAENLPKPPTTALDWQTDSLVDLDETETEEDDPDWDDIAMLIGSEIVRNVRATVREKLKYTCSGGISRNKMLAKLGSGRKKPNKQTVIRNRAVQHFLSSFKFTQIRMLGGKLGDEVVQTFGTDLLKELLEIPLDRLKRLGEDTGTWLYGIIRGEDSSEINPRTQIKSMLSAKSFRPPINTIEQAGRWLRIFVADIFSRCIEEGVIENKRRPKTINLHYRTSGHTRSKQAPIPQGKTLDENILYRLARHLLAQVVAEGRAWPCTNLSLSVGGFEDGITGNRGIGSFLVRGEEAKAMIASGHDHGDVQVDDDDISGAPKRRKLAPEGSIGDFFHSRSPSDDDVEQGEGCKEASPSSLSRRSSPNPAEELAASNWKCKSSSATQSRRAIWLSSESHFRREDIETYFCTLCNKHMAPMGRSEHEDWHFAKDLHDEEHNNQKASTNEPTMPGAHRSITPGSKPESRGNGGVANPGKGQLKLAF
ncbi:sister chromatid cohesion protein Eso1 [Lineolata rhizophorae]|uniref:DNA polymerase eta n=1 Tax=Lineolata rhizophorae TaxID=578093 RepID=A0A6A6NQL5_9PEZI|nr:sister chromatid cohesion protein Eso1 [Lineolata rhizophorae]